MVSSSCDSDSSSKNLLFFFFFFYIFQILDKFSKNDNDILSFRSYNIYILMILLHVSYRLYIRLDYIYRYYIRYNALNLFSIRSSGRNFMTRTKLLKACFQKKEYHEMQNIRKFILRSILNSNQLFKYYKRYRVCVIKVLYASRTNKILRV